MRSPGKITHTIYDEQSMLLRVEFDTLRVVIFQDVPREIAHSLFDRSTRDAVLTRTVLGKFPWGEVGVPSYD